MRRLLVIVDLFAVALPALILTASIDYMIWAYWLDVPVAR